MLHNKFFIQILIAYLAAGISFSFEEYLLSNGSQWSMLPPISFVALFVGLWVNSKQATLFALLTLPALLLAEKQFFLIIFMVLPYLFSSNPGI
jgi:hypothetical protein